MASNESLIVVSPLQDVQKQEKIGLAITLLTPYPASSEAYLHKLNVAPSRLGLS